MGDYFNENFWAAIELWSYYAINTLFPKKLLMSFISSCGAFWGKVRPVPESRQAMYDNKIMARQAAV
jgi:hypothetical protein